MTNRQRIGLSLLLAGATSAALAGFVDLSRARSDASLAFAIVILAFTGAYYAVAPAIWQFGKRLRDRFTGGPGKPDGNQD